MKTLMAMLGTFVLGSAAPAFAQTTADFTLNTEVCTVAPCPKYLTNNDAVTVEYVNVSNGTIASTSTVVASVNGVVYRGSAVYTITATIRNVYGNHEYIFHYDNGVLFAADGSSLLLTMDVDYKSILIRSGHNYYRHSYTVLSGTITLP